MSDLLFHMIAGAPEPVAPFSHAVEADGWVFVTGQMPFEGRSNTSSYPVTIEDQTHQVFKNLTTVLQGSALALPTSRRCASIFCTSTRTTRG